MNERKLYIEVRALRQLMSADDSYLPATKKQIDTIRIFTDQALEKTTHRKDVIRMIVGYFFKSTKNLTMHTMSVLIDYLKGSTDEKGHHYIGEGAKDFIESAERSLAENSIFDSWKIIGDYEFAEMPDLCEADLW